MTWLLRPEASSHAGVRGLDQIAQRFIVDLSIRPEFDMPHCLAAAFQQTAWIGQAGAKEEADIDVFPERGNAAKRRIPDARGRMAVMQQLAHVVAALPHLLEPCPCDGTQLGRTLAHPAIDSRIAFHAAGDPEKVLATGKAAQVQRNARKFARAHGRGA